MTNLEYFKGDELASNVWFTKYKLGNESTPKDMHIRLAYNFAKIENKYNKNIDKSELPLSTYGKERENLTSDRIFNLFNEFKYIVPGGSVMAGLGSDSPVSLSNCFVLPSPKDSISSIFDTARDMAQIYKKRGGVGLDISELRPNGAVVHNAASTSTGSVSFMRLYSTVTEIIGQSGRRGALMLSIDIRHPDVIDFITCKSDLSKITGANISVKINQEFKDAVDKDEDYILKWPIDAPLPQHPENLNYKELTKVVLENNQTVYYKKVKAKKLWDLLNENTWRFAEPGILIYDRLVNYDPTGVYDELRPVSTNPCFAGDTLLLTNKGYQTFRDLANKYPYCFKGDFLPTLINECGEQVEGKVWSNGYKHVIKLVFDNHQFIECTPNHVFKLIDGTSCEAYSLIGKIIMGYDGNHSKVTKIIDDGEIQEVFDFNLSGDNHWGVVGGLIAHNCGEIGLSPYDSCRLICTNLFSLVKNPFNSNAELDYDLAYKVFYECQVLADDLVDLELEAIDKILLKIQPEYKTYLNLITKIIPNHWFEEQTDEFKLWWKIRKMGELGRRTGCGITALGDMYAALGVEYGNTEVTNKLFYTKLKAELDATIDLGILRGTFPLWESALEYLDSDLTGGNDWYSFVQKEYPEQYERMVVYGRRNSSFSTCAPTGSISILTGTTSGIEPLFKPYYVRRKKCNPGETPTFVDQNGVGFIEYTVLHPKFKEWYIVAAKCSHCPEVALEAIKNATKDDLDKIFERSPWYKQTADDLDWKVRINTQALIQKYITSSISSTVNLPKNTPKSVVENLYNEAIAKGLKGITCYVDGSRSGILVDAKSSKTEELFEQHKAPKRPKVLKANSFTIKSLGNTYCVLVGLFQNKPYEVFVMKQPSVSLDKDGSITKIDKHHYSWNDKNNTYIDNIITNLADESAEQTLALMVSMLLRTGAELQFIIKTIKKSTNTIVSFQSALVRVLSKYLTKPIETNELCPDCNTPLVNENGCCICKNCGYSKCG